MPIGTASALVGAGALASAFGGKKQQTTQQQQTGFQALPQEVQDLLLQQYLPKAQSTLNMPYQNIPMQRAVNPAGDPFASQGMWDLQKFSDAAGGLFTPFTKGQPNGVVNAPSYQGAAGNVAAQGGNAQPVPAMPGANPAASGLKITGVQNNQSGRPFVTLSDGRAIPLNNFSNPQAAVAGAAINPQTLQLMGA